MQKSYYTTHGSSRYGGVNNYFAGAAVLTHGRELRAAGEGDQRSRAGCAAGRGKKAGHYGTPWGPTACHVV